jgi:hypothetical protein
MLVETAEKIVMAVTQDNAKANVIELLRQFGLAAMHDSKVQNELMDEHSPDCRCEVCRFWS